MRNKPLLPYSLNPQLSFKGGVVNIPVEINDMVKFLPRDFDETQTIQIRFERHVEHKTNHMHETVRSWLISSALEIIREYFSYMKLISIILIFLNINI